MFNNVIIYNIDLLGREVNLDENNKISIQLFENGNVLKKVIIN